VVAAKYDAKNDVFAIKLASGVEILAPRKLLQGLEKARPTQLSNVRIVGAQSGLRWGAIGKKGDRPKRISALRDR
jgi:uncharacterized protein DUF2442